MAKGKLYAKVRFDDGSNVQENGKAVDYRVGDEYKGQNADKLLEQGLLCSEKDLLAKEVVDEKDKVIAALEKKVAAQAKEIDQLKGEAPKKSKKQKVGEEPAESAPQA